MGTVPQKRILLVEDEAITALAEKNKLQKYGYDVISVLSGEEAVEIALSDTHIDLILMDINLGSGIDGTEAAELILKKIDMPVVFLSSHTDPEIVGLTEKITSYGYVVKNSGITVLDASIKMAFKLFEANSEVREKEKTEEELQKNRERFSLAMEAVQDGLWDWNLANHEIYYSPAYAEMLGYTLKELPQNVDSWSDIIHIDDKENALTAKKRCIENNCSSFKVEFRMKAKDGSYRWILSQGKVINRDNTGKALRLIGTHTDITEQKLVEEGLKHKQDLLESIFSNIQGISYRCAMDKDWTMIYMSPHVEHLTGYPREDFLNNTVRTYESIIHREDSKKVEAAIQNAVDSNVPWEVEYRIIHHNKEIRYLYEKGKAFYNPDGSVDHLDGLIIDITEKTVMGQKLIESEILFSRFMDFVPGAVFIKDHFNQILFVNQYMKKYFGAESWLGKTVHEIFPKEMAETMTADDKLTYSAGYQKTIENITHIDQSIHIYETQKFVIERHSGPSLLGGIAVDITDRVAAAENLKKSENRYRLLADNSADLVWTCGTKEENFTFTYINPAVEDMLGYTVEEFLKLPFKKLLTQKSLSIFEESLEATSISGETGLFQLQYIHKNSKILDCELSVKPVYSSDGSVTGFQGRTIDITVRKMAEELLAEQTVNLIGRVNELNCLYGLSQLIENTNAPLKEIYQGTVNLLPPAWQYPKITCALLVFDNNEYTTDNYQKTPWQMSCEIFIHNKQRGVFTVGYLSEQAPADEGPFLKEEKALLNEIAERLGHLTEHRNAEAEIKRLLEEKKIFLKEIHHRIKNNMAMVEGLLSLQLEAVKNPDAVSALQNSINRVTGMRILYDKLIITDDYEMLSVSQYINDLIDSIFSTFPPGKDVIITRNISDFQLSSKVLFPLGIILNELLTNVLKYAFDIDDKGIIKVVITYENSHVTLSIHDDGKGLPDDFDSSYKTKGFGLLLVQMLSKQLRGTFTITGSQGTVSILEFDTDK